MSDFLHPKTAELIEQLSRTIAALRLIYVSQGKSGPSWDNEPNVYIYADEIIQKIKALKGLVMVMDWDAHQMKAGEQDGK